MEEEYFFLAKWRRNLEDRNLHRTIDDDNTTSAIHTSFNLISIETLYESLNITCCLVFGFSSLHNLAVI